MAEPGDPRLEALAAAIARIEERLARLEAALHLAGPPAAARKKRRLPRPPRLELRMGATWINRIGVVTLVLGVAFFFKYAVDNRWIGKAGRVALGTLGGLAMLGAGEALWRRGQGVFAQGITAAGLAILYVSFYAAFGLYRLIPQPAAFGLMLLNTAAAGALALRYSAAAIAALGLFGAYLTPVVLNTGQDAPWFFFSYVLLLGVAACALSRRRGWRMLEPLALAGTAWLYFTWVGDFFRPEKRALAAGFALAYYALFVTRNFIVVAAAAPAALFAELVAISAPQPFPFLAAAPPAIAAALARGARRAIALAAFGSFWLAYAVGHLSFRDHGSREAIFLFLALIFAMYLWRAGERRVSGWIVAALNPALFYSFSYDLLKPRYGAWLGLFTLLLAGVYAAIARRRDALYAGIALAFLTLAVPIQIQGYRATMAWALEGAALAWIGARARRRELAWGAAAVFALVLLRLIFADAWLPSPTALLNLRFATFLTAAAAFWLAARFRAPARGALVSYVAGHGVLIGGLVLDVLAWAARNFPGPDLPNAQSTAVSIVTGGYAVALVGIGIATRTAANRVLGLALIALVVAKLYLYDVWRITRGMYRVAAFAALGALLLVTSYLYSRYRGMWGKL